MKNEKTLLMEIKELEKEFKNKQDEYMNYHHIIDGLSRFVNDYESLLNDEQELTKLKKWRLPSYFLFVLLECVLFCLIPPIIFELIIILAVFNFGLVIPLLLCFISSNIKLSENLNKVKKEINENKSKYLKQKSLITLYNKEQDKIGEYLTEILDKIRTKEIELFQSGENDDKDMNLILENTNQNQFEKECYNNYESKETQFVLIKKK